MGITKQGNAVLGTFGKQLGAGFTIGKGLAIGAGMQTMVGLGQAVAKAVKEINNNGQRKMLVQQLRQDPVLSNVPEEQFMEWYATIVHFAPKLSLDKSTVKEIMSSFARFGRVDINTVKTLAETEKAMHHNDNGGGWGNILSGIASGVGLLGVSHGASKAIE